ncbi:MAG: PIG-L family deacetylase [Chloroflexota bacterium]|nr:PIG-L family deacetylase [Chloroflexota bacterium]
MSSDTQPCIMVIGAHAADAEIMGGATVLKHVDAGWRAVMVHMTPGEKGHPKLSPQEYKAIKDKEAEEAAKVLGADSVMMPWPDGELPVNEDVQMAVGDVIRQYRPNIILTHWKGSFHRDHNNTYHNVLASLFFAGLPAFEREHPPHRPEKIYFAENWEDVENFRPEIYVDVSGVWDRYIEAIHAYSLFRGEVVSFRYEQWYRGASKMRGAEAGFDRAVALMPHETYFGSRTNVELLGTKE